MDSEFNRILICHECHVNAQQYRIPLLCVILGKLSVVGWNKAKDVRSAVGKVLGRDITEMDVFMR